MPDRRRGTTVLLPLALLLLSLLAPLPADADIYLGRTDTGSLLLTNDPASGGARETFTLIHESNEDTGDLPDLETLEEIVGSAAERYSLPESLIYAVIHVESDGETRARSHKGAVGLMQLMPETARLMGVEDPNDPADNIDGGSRYLRNLMRRFDGDLDRVLAAYNAGPTTVAENGGVPSYPETRRFVRRVKEQFERFKVKDEMIYTYRDENGTVHVTNIR